MILKRQALCNHLPIATDRVVQMLKRGKKEGWRIVCSVVFLFGKQIGKECQNYVQISEDTHHLHHQASMIPCLRKSSFLCEPCPLPLSKPNMRVKKGDLGNACTVQRTLLLAAID